MSTRKTIAANRLTDNQNTVTSDWIRPSDWLAMPDISPTEQKIAILIAVSSQTGNYQAIYITGNSSPVATIDWGDGSTSTPNSGGISYKNYVYSNLSSTTQTSDGYRQALLTITAPAGIRWSVVQISNYSHTSEVAGNRTRYGLDIIASVGTATFVPVGTTTATWSLLQRVHVLSCNMSTSFLYGFYNSSNLREVTLPQTGSPTDIRYMFYGCISLKNAPLVDCSSTTSASSAFGTCYNLINVPDLKFTSALKNTSSMFAQCTKLKKIPWKIDLSGVTTTSSMFSTCSSLEEGPDITTSSSLLIASAMYASCFNMRSAKLIDTSGATDLSGMHQSNYILEVIPDYNASSNTNFNTFFYNLPRLKKIPNINLNGSSTAVTTNYGNFWDALLPIQDIGTVDMSKNTSNTSPLINNSQNLQSFTFTGLNVGVNVASSMLSAASLDNLYTNSATLNASVTSASGNGTTVTITVGTANILPYYATRTVTLSGMNPTAYNISGTIASSNRSAGTFTITSTATGTFVSGGTAQITNFSTHTVTGAFGAPTDNPSIATAKGWTVTG